MNKKLQATTFFCLWVSGGSGLWVIDLQLSEDCERRISATAKTSRVKFYIPHHPP